MSDPVKSSTSDLVPVHALVIGSGTGDGGSVKNNAVGETPENQPNIVIRTITPLMVTTIRAGKIYVQTLLGLITAGAVKPELLGVHDFTAVLYSAAYLSVASAGMSVLTSALELLTELNQKYPRLSV